MSGASKGKKYRAQHEQALRTAEREKHIQQAYINQYQNFASGNPTFASRGNAHPLNMMKAKEKPKYRGNSLGFGGPTDNFTLWDPDVYRKWSTPGTTISTRKGLMTTTYTKSKSTYKSIADRLRPKAIQAELSGIQLASTRQSQLIKKGAKKPGSKRGMGGTGSSIARDADGFFISIGGITGLTSKNQSKIKDYSNAGYVEMKNLTMQIEAKDEHGIGLSKIQKDKLKKEYQNKQRNIYLANFGTSMDDARGSDTAKLKDESKGYSLDLAFNASTGGLDEKYLSDLTPFEQDEFRTDLSQKLINEGIATSKADNLKAQAKKEKEILAKQAEITAILNTTNTITPKDQWGNQSAQSLSSNPFGSNAGYESIYGDSRTTNLNIELAQLKVDLQGIQDKRTEITSMISTGGESNFYKQLYNQGKIGADTAGLLLTTTASPDYSYNMNLVRTMGLQKDLETTKQSQYAVLKTQLKSLDKNKNKPGYEQKRAALMSKVDSVLPHIVIEGEKKSLGKEIHGDTLNEGFKILDRDNDQRTTIKGVIQQMDKAMINQASTISDLNESQSYLSMNMSKALTNEQRVGVAGILRQDQIGKQTVEDLTGIKLKAGTIATNMSPRGLTQDYMEQNPALIKSYGEAGHNVQRMNQWLDDGGSAYQYQNRAFDLIMEGTYDPAKQSNAKKIKDVVKKYHGGWGTSAGVLSNALNAWQGDVKKYYDESYHDSNVSMSDQEILDSALQGGASPREGESYATAAEESVLGVGVKINYNDRDKRSQRRDLAKVLRLSIKSRSVLLKAKLDNEKYLIEARKQKIILTKKHDSHKPEVEKRIESAMIVDSQGINRPQEIDDKFSKKLIASSQAIYDINNQIKQNEIQQKYYEGSLNKTDVAIEQMKKNKRTLDYNLKRQTSSSGMINRLNTRSHLYGYNKARKHPLHKTNTSKKITRSGSMSLGGLVL